MLHFEAIEKQALGLLKELQLLDGFEELRLVGGTSLGLQLGHRLSIDLDLFGKIELDKDTLIDRLKNLGVVKVLNYSEAIKVFLINDVKLDIVNHKYPWIDECLLKDNIKMATMKDIALMKLSAITNRGAKKDFIDLYYLLDLFSLDELLPLYEKKYNDGSIFLVLKSLLYFKDASNTIIPQDLNVDEIMMGMNNALS